MNDKKIAICGFGMVGKSTAFALGIPENHCYNSKNKDTLIERINEGGWYDTFIICLPTPTVNGTQDLSAIEYWLTVIKNQLQSAPNPDLLIIIRSTVLPGTTKRLSEEYGLKIAHVPEFLTEATAISDEVNPEFLVIGADDILIKEKVRDIFRNSKIQVTQIILCNTQTAELIKYSLNSFFALKVVFANQLWDVATKTGADFGKIKAVMEKHKWGSKNGWDVWQGGFRGAGGNCLPKDLEAFSNTFDVPLLKEVNRINKDLTAVK